MAAVTGLLSLAPQDLRQGETGGRLVKTCHHNRVKTR